MWEQEATADETAPPPVGTGIDASAGLATRVLTIILLPFTTLWEVGKLVVLRCVDATAGAVAGIAHLMAGAARHVGQSFGAAASALWNLSRPLRTILRWCGRGIAWVYAKVTDAFVIAALALRLIGQLLAPALRRAAHIVRLVFVAVATAVAALARLVLAALTLLVRPLVLLGRVALSLGAWILRRLWACVIVATRGIAALAKCVAWLTARIVMLIVRPIALVARALAVVARVLAAVILVAFRHLASIAVVIGRALAVVGLLLGSIGGAAARMLGKPARAVASVVAIVLRPFARAVAWSAKGMVFTVEAVARRISGTLRASSGRVVQGSLVAFGTARHHARNLPRTGTVDTLGPLPAPMVADNIDERPLAAVFTATSHQNPYLPPGGSQVEGIVSVTADIAMPDERSREAVEIFLLDCSGSMGHPWDKIRALRKATRAALEILPDGVWFAVVRGADTAEVVYPPTNGLVQASPRTRKEAVATLATLQPVGGTAIGQWLTLAARLSALRPGAIHHALLLTDGKDEDESAQELEIAVAASVGRFQCDCRGIGSDWAVSELRQISSALLGSVDIIRQPVDMEEDFRNVIGAALARQVEATLQVWVPERARVRFIRQVSPTIEDLTPRSRAFDARTIEIPTGAWTTEAREYHVSIDVPPGPLDAEMLACRVSLLVGGRKHTQALMKASWTDEAALFTPISPDVAHYTDQAELARAIQEGLAARRAGDQRRATDKLGRAVQLAAQSKRHATSQLLADVVDVEDAMTGRVTLRAYVEDADEMTLDARSTRTTRSGPTFDTTSRGVENHPNSDEHARI